jgi:hypothetical protein
MPTSERDQRYIPYRRLASGVVVVILCKHNKLLAVFRMQERLGGRKASAWLVEALTAEGKRIGLQTHPRKVFEGTERNPRCMMHRAGYFFDPPRATRSCSCSISLS